MMSNDIKVGISDYKIAKAPDQLLTLGLGSCIGIVIYDKKNKIAGLSHIMLPDSEMFTTRSMIKVEKFADLAIPAMVEEIKKLQPNHGRLAAKIAGGASMFKLANDVKSQNVGERNIEAVEKALKELRIPIVAKHVGGNMGRSIFVNVEEMTISIKMVNREVYEL